MSSNSSASASNFVVSYKISKSKSMTGLSCEGSFIGTSNKIGLSASASLGYTFGSISFEMGATTSVSYKKKICKSSVYDKNHIHHMKDFESIVDSSSSLKQNESYKKAYFYSKSNIGILSGKDIVIKNGKGNVLNRIFTNIMPVLSVVTAPAISELMRQINYEDEGIEQSFDDDYKEKTEATKTLEDNLTYDNLKIKIIDRPFSRIICLNEPKELSGGKTPNYDEIFSRNGNKSINAYVTFIPNIEEDTSTSYVKEENFNQVAIQSNYDFDEGFSLCISGHLVVYFEDKVTKEMCYYCSDKPVELLKLPTINIKYDKKKDYTENQKDLEKRLYDQIEKFFDGAKVSFPLHKNFNVKLVKIIKLEQGNIFEYPTDEESKENTFSIKFCFVELLNNVAMHDFCKNLAEKSVSQLPIKVIPNIAHPEVFDKKTKINILSSKNGQEESVEVQFVDDSMFFYRKSPKEVVYFSINDFNSGFLCKKYLYNVEKKESNYQGEYCIYGKLNKCEGESNNQDSTNSPNEQSYLVLEKLKAIELFCNSEGSLILKDESKKEKSSFKIQAFSFQFENNEISALNKEKRTVFQELKVVLKNITPPPEDGKSIFLKVNPDADKNSSLKFSEKSSTFGDFLNKSIVVYEVVSDVEITTDDGETKKIKAIDIYSFHISYVLDKNEEDCHFELKRDFFVATDVAKIAISAPNCPRFLLSMPVAIVGACAIAQVISSRLNKKEKKFEKDDDVKNLVFDSQDKIFLSANNIHIKNKKSEISLLCGADELNKKESLINMKTPSMIEFIVKNNNSNKPIPTKLVLDNNKCSLSVGDSLSYNLDKNKHEITTKNLVLKMNKDGINIGCDTHGWNVIFSEDKFEIRGTKITTPLSIKTS